MRRILLFCLALATVPAAAQSLEVGTNATAEIATWNVEWFGSAGNGPGNEPLQLQNAVRVISESEVDLWALQEMDSPAAFNDLLAGLGAEFDGRVGTGSTNLHLGFVYRKDRVRLRQIREVLTTFDSEFAGRPPLRGEFDLLLPDTTVTVTVFSIHMKARSDVSSYMRRRDAAERLKNHIDFALDGQAVVVAGDFNDELQRSITGGFDSPYANFRDDPDYRFLTSQMEESGVGTFCGSSSSCSTGSTIDHLLANDRFLAGTTITTDRLEGALSAIDRFVFTTSDHLPVYSRITFGTSTAVEPVASPRDSALRLYPNPATIGATLESPVPVQISVFDVLGRKVHTSNAAQRQHQIDVSGLPPGLYLVRTEGGRSALQVSTLLVRGR